MGRKSLSCLGALVVVLVAVGCSDDDSDVATVEVSTSDVETTTSQIESGDHISADLVDFTPPDGWEQRFHDAPAGRVYVMVPPPGRRGPTEFPTQITVVLAVERVDDAADYFDTVMDLTVPTVTDRFPVEIEGAASAERVSITSSTTDGLKFVGEYLAIVSHEREPIEVLCYGAVGELDRSECEQTFDSFRLRT